MDPNPSEVETLRSAVRDLQERVDAIAVLEDRVRVAEARALDAERRLQELTDQVSAADEGRKNAPSEASDLRARLARTTSKKKPGGRDGR
jgi:predicted  nucleic acid-binding Zn-ribbon protein